MSAKSLNQQNLVTPIKDRNVTSNRITYIDHIRIFLVILVIFHHIAIGYGGVGDWVLKEKPSDPISPIVLTIFNAVNQSFFMSLFFFISAYFIPKSIDRKGAARFCRDRLIRLGIPVLVYAYLISPVIRYIVSNYINGEPATLAAAFSKNFKLGGFVTGPLWFVEALLLYSFAYTIFRLVADYLDFNFNKLLDLRPFPSNKTIMLCIILIALGTFSVRLWYPVGMTFYHFQLGHHLHYVFCFWVGILACRGDWLNTLPGSQAKRWGYVALINIIILPIMIGWTRSHGIPVEALLGGLSWISLTVSLWDSIGCLAISFWLISFCKHRLNTQRLLTQILSSNAYTVYIIHVLIALVVQGILLEFSIPSIAKFIIAGFCTVSICFLISHYLIRRIPLIRYVLG